MYVELDPQPPWTYLTVDQARSIFAALLAYIPLILIADFLQLRGRDTKTIQQLRDFVSDIDLASQKVAAGETHYVTVEELRVEVTAENLGRYVALRRRANAAAMFGAGRFSYELLIASVGLFVSLFGLVSPTEFGLAIAFAFAILVTYLLLLEIFMTVTSGPSSLVAAGWVGLLTTSPILLIMLAVGMVMQIRIGRS